MPRVKRGTITHKRHANLLEQAKGYRTGRHKLIKRAREAVLQAGQFAYRDRRTKKRQMRRGWIGHINAAVRMHDISYSRFMEQARKSGLTLNRKILSELALKEPQVLESIINQVKAAKK